MKKLFRKATAIAGNIALIGATVGMAAAASYPEPFTSNTAVVVGANAAPTDNIAAASLASDLDANAAGGASITFTGADSYMLEKTSTKYHLGDSIDDVIGTDANINEDDMPELLAEGEYTDKDNDNFDYSQKVVMNNLQLTFFEDTDYARDEPTMGFQVAKNTEVLTYTFTFDDEPVFADLETTELPLMGREYYVLDAAATNDKLTLLDSASDTIIAEGETSTITAGGKSYTVSIEFVDSDSAKLNVNGELTNDITAGSTYKLDDGSYLGMKEVLYSAKDTGISKVEFSIGNGKLVVENGQTVELNEKNVDGLTAVITNNSADLTSIALTWTTEDEEFVTETSEIVMPGFETLKFNYAGIEFPAEEEFSVEADGTDSIALKNFPMKGTTEDINIAWFNSTSGEYEYTGKEFDALLSLDGTYDGDTDDWALLSWNDSDESESYLVRAINFDDVDNDGAKNETTIQVREGGVWVDVKDNAEEDDEFSLGELDVTIGAINVDDETIVFHGAVSNSTLYSEEGMAVSLAQTNNTTWTYTFYEEDEDDILAGGDNVVVVIGDNTDDEAEVDSATATSGSGAKDTSNSDVTEAYTYSAVPTKVTMDNSGDQGMATLVYSGSEVMAEVYLNSAETSTESGDAGVMTVKDSEVATVSGKNLVVVGGSAINSVAAELLGGAYSEAEFTSMTDVAAGEFLIQSFSRSGKTALLVAGYNAADTEKAATYLLNNDVDTTVGMKMKGTSATEATVVTA